MAAPPDASAGRHAVGAAGVAGTAPVPLPFSWSAYLASLPPLAPTRLCREPPAAPPLQPPPAAKAVPKDYRAKLKKLSPAELVAECTSLYRQVAQLQRADEARQAAEAAKAALPPPRRCLGWADGVSQYSVELDTSSSELVSHSSMTRPSLNSPATPIEFTPPTEGACSCSCDCILASHCYCRCAQQPRKAPSARGTAGASAVTCTCRCFCATPQHWPRGVQYSPFSTWSSAVLSALGGAATAAAANSANDDSATTQLPSTRSSATASAAAAASTSAASATLLAGGLDRIKHRIGDAMHALPSHPRLSTQFAIRPVASDAGSNGPAGPASLGLFARQPFSRGQQGLLEYVGAVRVRECRPYMAKGSFEARRWKDVPLLPEPDPPLQPSNHIVQLHCASAQVPFHVFLDSSSFGNESRCIRLTSERRRANVRLVPWLEEVSGERRMRVDAMRDIKAGDELVAYRPEREWQALACALDPHRPAAQPCTASELARWTGVVETPASAADAAADGAPHTPRVPNYKRRRSMDDAHAPASGDGAALRHSTPPGTPRSGAAAFATEDASRLAQALKKAPLQESLARMVDASTSTADLPSSTASLKYMDAATAQDLDATDSDKEGSPPTAAGAAAGMPPSPPLSSLLKGDAPQPKPLSKWFRRKLRRLEQAAREAAAKEEAEASAARKHKKPLTPEEAVALRTKITLLRVHCSISEPMLFGSELVLPAAFAKEQDEQLEAFRVGLLNTAQSRSVAAPPVTVLEPIMPIRPMQTASHAGAAAAAGSAGPSVAAASPALTFLPFSPLLAPRAELYAVHDFAPATTWLPLPERSPLLGFPLLAPATTFPRASFRLPRRWTEVLRKKKPKLAQPASAPTMTAAAATPVATATPVVDLTSPHEVTGWGVSSWQLLRYSRRADPDDEGSDVDEPEKPPPPSSASVAGGWILQSFRTACPLAEHCPVRVLRVLLAPTPPSTSEPRLQGVYVVLRDLQALTGQLPLVRTHQMQLHVLASLAPGLELPSSTVTVLEASAGLQPFGERLFTVPGRAAIAAWMLASLWSAVRWLGSPAGLRIKTRPHELESAPTGPGDLIGSALQFVRSSIVHSDPLGPNLYVSLLLHQQQQEQAKARASAHASDIPAAAAAAAIPLSAAAALFLPPPLVHLPTASSPARATMPPLLAGGSPAKMLSLSPLGPNSLHMAASTVLSSAAPFSLHPLEADPASTSNSAFRGAVAASDPNCDSHAMLTVVSDSDDDDALPSLLPSTVAIGPEAMDVDHEPPHPPGEAVHGAAASPRSSSSTPPPLAPVPDLAASSAATSIAARVAPLMPPVTPPAKSVPALASPSDQEMKTAECAT